MNKFREWYLKYQEEITWWVIGWLSFGVIDCILKESWIFAIVNAGLIYLNYKLWKNNNA